MKRLNVGALGATVAGLTLVACGDLGDVHERAPLAVIEGQLTQASTASGMDAAANVHIAIVWSEPSNFRSTYDVPATPVFPSKFRIGLTDPPPASAMWRFDVDGSTTPTEDRTTGLGQQARTLTTGASDFKMAVGAIVAYEDRNGNGQLDLLATGDSPVDRVLGANDTLAIVYLEGEYVSPFNVELSGKPAPGYNLLRTLMCEARVGTSTPPCASPTWLPISTAYELPLTAEPELAELMCRSSVSSVDATPTTPITPSDPPPAPGPNGWPATNDPDLLCAPDGTTYTVVHCEITSLGLCRGSHQSCTQATYRLPSTPPPPEWPCPMK